jgi:hypothetical protein
MSKLLITVCFLISVTGCTCLKVEPTTSVKRTQGVVCVETHRPEVWTLDGHSNAGTTEVCK